MVPCRLVPEHGVFLFLPSLIYIYIYGTTSTCWGEKKNSLRRSEERWCTILCLSSILSMTWCRSLRRVQLVQHGCVLATQHVPIWICLDPAARRRFQPTTPSFSFWRLANFARLARRGPPLDPVGYFQNGLVRWLGAAAMMREVDTKLDRRNVKYSLGATKDEKREPKPAFQPDFKSEHFCYLLFKMCHKCSFFGHRVVLLSTLELLVTVRFVVKTLGSQGFIPGMCLHHIVAKGGSGFRISRLAWFAHVRSMFSSLCGPRGFCQELLPLSWYPPLAFFDLRVSSLLAVGKTGGETI